MGKSIKFIVYIDDDEKIKEKHAIIEEDDFWVTIQLYNIDTQQPYNSPTFKIPRTRVLKIKDVRFKTK